MFGGESGEDDTVARNFMDKLKKLLDQYYDGDITAFSRRTGIAINTLRRIILDGKPCRRATAQTIVRCFKKEITLKDFGYE